MQEIKTLKEADVAGKRVLVRVDFNVPLKDGKVVDDMRIRAAVPTIHYLHEHGAKEITLVTHVGRPEGKVVEALRVAPIAARLRELTQVPCTLLENVRFNGGEEAGDSAFAKELASHGDIFINDAFADSHRAHASIVGVAKLLPSYAGLLVEAEVANLAQALTPPKGAVAIIGGAKFETKQPLIEKLLSLYERVLLGGALGNDVIKSRGMPIGASLVSKVPVPTSIAADERLLVANDIVVGMVGANAERTCLVNDIRANERIIDIGPATALLWSEVIKSSPFVLWNGPMGIYEEGYRDGTDVLAQALVASNARAVVGGGDTVAAVAKHTFDPARVFLSTGGGAMLEFLTTGTLPGLEVLKK